MEQKSSKNQNDSRPLSSKIKVMNQPCSSRTFAELEVLAITHFNRKQHHRGKNIDVIVANIANDELMTPSKAIKMAQRVTRCEDCAKSVRWLAVIARDHGLATARQVIDKHFWKLQEGGSKKVGEVAN